MSDQSSGGNIDVSGGSDRKKQGIATIAGGIIGGMVGGYPGMQIGMAIGGFLFKPDEPKDKDYVNPDHKLYRSKIDPVPDVIGTDICPAKIIWLNKDTLGVYSSSDMPSMGESVNEAAWIDIFNMMSATRVGQWAEFAFNFSGQYYRYGTHENQIGVIKFNSKPFWFWLMLSDMFENYDNPLNPYNPLTHLDGQQGNYFQALDINTVINQPVKWDTVGYFKGFLGDFTGLQTDPAQSNWIIDVQNLEDFNPKNFQMGQLNAFPTITAEINRDAVWYSPESFQGGTTSVGSGYPYLQEDLLPAVLYDYPVMSSAFGCRDARNKMWYGFGNYGLTYCNPGERLIRHVANDSGYEEWEVEEIDQWFYDNFAKGGSTLQATDVNDNRAYICKWRNWWEPNQGRGVYGMDKVSHHHAEYGVRFDLYYHDLDDPKYRAHSVLYNYEFNLPGENEASNPRVYFSSMVVGKDYVYVFGGKTQTDVILGDHRTIVSGANTYSRVYCDLSQYPDGWWNGMYASLQQNAYDLWREIINQTSTYIDLDGEFAAFPSPGEVVALSKYPSQVTDFAIVGEGSTTTEIVCNPPSPSPWSAGGGKDWECVHFIGGWLYRKNIDYIDGTHVHLTSPLGSTPVPGSRICFGFDRVGGDYDTSITNPTLDDDPYDYTATFIELGKHNGFWPDYFGPSDPQWPFRPSTLNQTSGASHHICWKIDKNTGAVSVIDIERTWGYVYFTARLWTTGSISVYACATDKQAFVYSHGSGYPTAKQAYTYIIDFDTGIEEQVNRWNQYATSHAPQWCYMGTTSVKEWNNSTQEYEDVWYSVLRSFDSFGGLNDAVDQGTYFLKLSEGKFSNKQVYASNVPIEYGLDIDRRGIQKILYRKNVATGPMNMAMDLGNFSNEKKYQLGKYGIREHIYFYVIRANAQAAGRHEMWKYIPPSEDAPAGELYMIAKYPMEVNNIKYQWNRIGTGGSFAHTKSGFFGNGSGLWYYCDETPSEVIEKFWDFYNDPRYFPISMNNELTLSEANVICKGTVDAKIYTPTETIDVKERRFQFSNCYDQPKKMHDVINEVLSTCQGFISPCLWNDPSNLFKLIIPNPDETPVAWFGRVSAGFTSNQLSDDKTKIYADFSAYPDNYWKGDIVDYGEVMDHWSPAPDSRTNVIIEQTSTYIDMGMALQEYWPDAKGFTLKKDNIKEGSFTFAEKSEMDRPNKVRIEFKNRLLDYIKDVAEAEDTYRLDVLQEEEKIDFHKMHGIKRATQAGRMAQRILDQWNYQKYVCGFETDIMGFTLCMGEIIGVSHDITGWSNKWFRIVSMDEMVDFEVKLELEEFNPYTYHDSGVPVLNGFGYGGFPQPYVPYNVERFEVKEDIEFGKLYFTFDAPQGDAGFFVGARIYRKVGTEWEYIAIVNETVSSVRLAQDVEVDDTTIYYDNTTLTGSFPSQGIIWIENEMMYYHGLDTTNYAFTNVVRGYKDTDIVEHLIEDELYIKLRSDATVFYNMPSGWEGTAQTFKAASFTIQGLTATVDTAPSKSIDVVGYGILPYFPESIHIPIPEIAEVEYAFETMGFDDTAIGEIWEFLTETLGLNDTAVEEVVVWLSENLGLGDVKSIPETLAQLVENIGLDESATVKETLTALGESLGLGDDTQALVTEFITESLGFDESKTVAETLAQIVEDLGLDESAIVSETLIALTEDLGLGDALEAIEDAVEIFAWWKLEVGALITDSIGNNTLTNNNVVTADTSELKYGDASGSFLSASSKFLSIADADLDSGFPFKSGNTDTEMTICFWVYPKTISGEQVLIGKYEYYNNKRQWTLNMYGGDDIRFVMSTNGTSSTSYWQPLANIFTVNKWHHIALVIDDPNSQIKVRLWEEEGGILNDSDWDGYSGNIYDGGSIFHMGSYPNGATSFNGLIDDVRLFDGLLSDSEIDAIREEVLIREDGLAFESATGVLLLQSSDRLLLETQDQEELMMILNNNML